MIDPFGMCAEPGSGTKSKSFWGKLGSGIKKVGKGIAKGYDKISVWGHGILDVAGLVPGLGMVPDGVNTIWYLAEFDGANAAFSA